MEINLKIQGKHSWIKIETIVVPEYGPHYLVFEGNELTEDDVRSYPVNEVELVLGILNKFLKGNK